MARKLSDQPEPRRAATDSERVPAVGCAPADRDTGRLAPPVPPAWPLPLTAACVGLLILFTVAAWGVGLWPERFDLPPFEFVHWDDSGNYMDNKHIRGFSAENLRWMATTTLLGVWQPLTWFITAIEHAAFAGRNVVGEQDLGFRRGIYAVSLLTHAAAGVLCFFLARKLIRLAAPHLAQRDPAAVTVGAAFAAAVFAVHPFRNEIVAWASGQPYAFAMVPALGALLAYLKAHESGGAGGTPLSGGAGVPPVPHGRDARTTQDRHGAFRWQAVALVCLTCSLMCKAMAVPLVAVLLVLDFYPLRRFGRVRSPSPQPSPFKGEGEKRTPSLQSSLFKGEGAIRILLEKVPYAAVTLLTAAFTIYATISTKEYGYTPWSTKLPVAAYCMLFYVSVTFVPIGIAPYYMQPIPFRASDPWFAGAVAVFVVVTVALVLLRRRAPWLLACWAAHVLVLLPVVGLVRHGGQMAADRYSYLSCIGWAVLAGAAVARLWAGREAGSRADKGSHAERQPRGGMVLRRAAIAAACLALVAGLSWMSSRHCLAWHDTVSMWSAMIERNPRFHMGYYNLASAYKRGGDVPRAIETYRQALKLDPLYPEANVNLGNIYRTQGRFNDAIDCYQTALRGKPGFHMAHMNLSEALWQVGRREESLRHLQMAADGARAAKDLARARALEAQLEQARRNMRRPGG